MKKNFIGFILVFFQFQLHALGSQVLKCAHETFLQTESANNADLDFLLNFIKAQSLDFADLKSKAIIQLRNDQRNLATFAKIKNAVTTIAISSSIAKLIGNATYVGIIKEARIRLRKLEDLEHMKATIFELKGHSITVAKAMLLALAKATGAWDWDREQKHLRLIYPGAVSQLSNESVETALQTTFASQAQKEFEVNFHIPNSGFIFGGNLVNGEIKGLDCSSFVSYCANTTSRLSTLHLELIWLAKKSGRISYDPLVNANMDLFKAIDPTNLAEFKEGDLVVWRVGNTGHVAVFEQWQDQESGFFLGIHDVRADDKSLEGIVRSDLELQKKDAKLYVLRRVEV